jgi:hypothetical protein
VLAGTAVNQDGRSSSLTAPNGPSQQEVIHAALRSGGLAAWEVGHLQMHGTGTPLGDPIEVGAAAAALLRGAGAGGRRAAPLQLSAAKSFMGHAEPAAGIVGLTRLSLILGQSSVDPLLTLTALNPYVGAALAAAGQHGPADRAAAPRQPAPAPAPVAAALGGVSAFAFQGTNAHAFVSKDHAQGAAFCVPTAPVLFLRAAAAGRARFWVLPPAHPFASSVRIAGGKASGAPRGAVFECSLLAPRLALFSDHAVFGRVLFPAAGMLEAALAAGSLSVEASASGVLSVCGMTISNPLVIAVQPAGGALLLRCAVDPAAGTFALAHADRAADNAAGAYSVVAALTPGAPSPRAAPPAPAAAVLARLAQGGAARAAAAAGHAVGCIAVDPRLATDAYLVAPSCLDACLHLGVAAPGCGAKVPVAVGAFSAPSARAAGAGGASVGGGLFGGTTAPHEAPTGVVDVASFGLHTASGASLASLSALHTKVLKGKAGGGELGAAARAAQSVQPAEFLYEVEWDEVSHPMASASAGCLAPATPTPEAAAVLRLQGDAGDAVGVAAVRRGAGGAVGAAAAALQVVQGMPQLGATAVVASVQESHSGEAGHARLAAAAVEGLLRVAATENANAAFALAATHPLAAAQVTAPPPSKAIVASLRGRGGALAAPRLRRSAAAVPAHEMLQIRPLPRGSLHSLAAQPLSGGRLAPGSVLVAVKAVGINFRDVLNVLGMYPGDPGPPGSDCAGVVVSVGAGVTHLKPGTFDARPG